MRKSQSRIPVLAFLSAILAFCLFGMLAPAAAATNTPADTDPPDDCETKYNGDKEAYCANAADDEECCGCETCKEGMCSAPAGASALVRSIHFRIGVGRAPHESLSPCRLILKVEQPSEDAFSPSALKLIRPLGGEMWHHVGWVDDRK